VKPAPPVRLKGLVPGALTGAGASPTHRRARGFRRLLWLALGAFAGSVESSLIVSVLPAIAAETGVSLSQAGYLIFGYSIAYGIGTPLLSTVFGHLDRRSVVAGPELLFGLMALLLGVRPGFLLLVLARTFMALGAGLFTSTAQSTAVALAAPGKRGTAISTVVMGGSIAVAVGAPASALVAEFLGGAWPIWGSACWQSSPRALCG